MTSTLNSASTDRTLRRFATRRPEWFAVLVSLAYVLPALVIALLGPEQFANTTASPVLLAGIAWMVLLPAALLTSLGWWGTAGFTRRSTWRSLVPFLPLILLVVVPPLMGLASGPGVASHSPGYFALLAVTLLAVGFGQEATFRGVVLQTLLPRGVMRAVIVSSVLWGAASISNLAGGSNPVLVGGYVLVSVGLGVAFAAIVVVTGTIWPLVVIDAATYLVTVLQFSDNSSAGAPDPGMQAVLPTDAAPLVGSLVFAALAAAYGIRLLHRHRHQHRPVAP